MLHVSQVNEGRNRGQLPLLLAQNGPDARGLHVLVPGAPAHDVDVPGPVIIGIGMHGADEGELVGALGQLGQPVAQLNTGNVGWNRMVVSSNLKRRIRLEVIHVELAGAPLKKHEDDVDLPACAQGLIGQDFRQRETQGGNGPQRKAAHAEELSAIHHNHGIMEMLMHKGET